MLSDMTLIFPCTQKPLFRPLKNKSKSGTSDLKRRKMLVTGTFTWKSERKGFSEDGLKEGGPSSRGGLIKGWFSLRGGLIKGWSLIKWWSH